MRLPKNLAVRQKKNVKIVMDLRDQIKQQLEENKKSRGFGDTFEKFTTFNGFMVKKIVGVIEDVIYGINGFLIKMGQVVKNLVMINMYHKGILTNFCIIDFVQHNYYAYPSFRDYSVCKAYVGSTY